MKGEEEDGKKGRALMRGEMVCKVCRFSVLYFLIASSQ